MARNACEQLEGRLLLSAAGPTLSLTGTGGNDVIRLQIEAGVGSVQYDLVYTLNGTQFLYDDSTFGSINLNTLGGNDQVTVDGIRDHALTINLGSGADGVQVNYGTNSSPNNQYGVLPNTPIQVNGGGGADTLTFNSQRDGAENQYLIGGSSVAAGVNNGSGQFSSIDTLTYNGIQNLTVSTSGLAASPNVVNVAGTSIPTTINTAGGDVINITPVGQNLDAIQGPLTINGSHATLNVDDQANPSTDFTQYSVTGTQLIRVGEGLSYVNGLPLVSVNSATINCGGIGPVQLNTGAYPNVVQIQGTSAGMPVTVNPGTGTIEIDADQTDPTSPVIIGPGGSGEAVRVNANRAGSAHVLFNAPQTIGALTIGANGVAQIAPGGSNTLTVSSLVIPDTGKIDLADNLLMIHYQGGQDPNGLVAQMIQSGAIYSSTAHPGQSIGYQDNTGTQTELIEAPPSPTVASLSPAAGPLAGGSSVVITGTNFSSATGVTFGGIAATSFTINSPTQITAIDPAGMPGRSTCKSPQPPAVFRQWVRPTSSPMSIRFRPQRSSAGPSSTGTIPMASRPHATLHGRGRGLHLQLGRDDSQCQWRIHGNRGRPEPGNRPDESHRHGGARLERHAMGRHAHRPRRRRARVDRQRRIQHQH